MKSSNPNTNTGFFVTFLALASLNAIASVTSHSSPSLALVRSHTKRSLQNDGLDFDFGEWATGLWEDAVNVIGLGDGDGDGDGALGDALDSDNEANKEANDTGSGSDSGDGIHWGDVGAWNEWLAMLLDEIPDGRGDGLTIRDANGDAGFDLDVCAIVEMAIGMGSSFGIDASCECDGDFDNTTTGMAIGCSFEECAPGTDICGTVGLDFVFGGPDGTINMTACAEFTGGATTFQETCFSYEIDVKGGIDSGSGSGITQTCGATYGGQQCDCTIENLLCLSIDCSPFLPGAKIDTCQLLSMVDSDSLENWVPNFDVFQPGFELEADDIPWEILDFENLDFENFDVTAVRWGDPGAMISTDETTWRDLIGANPTFLEGADSDSNSNSNNSISSGVCALLSQAANVSAALGVEGSCTCSGSSDDGGAVEEAPIVLSCDFSESCAPRDGATVGDGDGNGDVLCGAVRMNLTFAGLAAIDADVCIRSADFPETCYSYGIPFAAPRVPDTTESDRLPGTNTDNDNEINDNEINDNDLTSPFRDCSARYGEGNTCKCTIDDNSCLKVDCTDFEPLAITDTCQTIALKDAVEPSRMVLNFRAVTEDDVVSDGNGGEFVALSSSGARVGSMAGSAGMLGLATVMATATGLWVG